MGVQRGISVLQYIALLAELQELFSELCWSFARIAKWNGRCLLVLGAIRQNNTYLAGNMISLAIDTAVFKEETHKPIL